MKISNKRATFTLAEGAAHGNMSDRFGQCAFTLAEVLITLGIIGIAAAVTIPIIIHKYQEKVTISKVKRFYSTFSNVMKLAIYENGNVNTWDLASESGYYDSVSAAKFVNYIRPYLKIMTDCGPETDGYCWPVSTYKWLNGASHNVTWGTDSRYYKMILADGSLILIRTYGNGCTRTDATVGVENECAAVNIDLNGQNGPNKFGEDLFFFYINPNGMATQTVDSCHLEGHGESCAQYIIQYGNMNYPKTAD